MIKTYRDEHTCVRADQQRLVDHKWLVDFLVKLLKKNIDMDHKNIKVELEKFNVDPPYMQLWRARLRAREQIHGSYKESYSLLPRYSEIVKQRNPGSVCVLEYEEDEPLPREPTFKRFFMGFGGVAKGFMKGCAPFLGFDGCHLHGAPGGVLLSAIGLDPNNGLFPIAFAVVEVECKDSWGFFFTCLGNLLNGLNTNTPWTFMTDRQKGLVEAIKQVVPNAINRKCARHILANLRKTHPGVLVKNLFWEACYAYNSVESDRAMQKLKLKRPGAWRWLDALDKKIWLRHMYDPRVKIEHVTNNFTESFNNWIDEFRGLPISKCMEGIRGKLMNKIHSRRIKAEAGPNKVCPVVLDRLYKNQSEISSCRILMSNDLEFEVCHDGMNFIVDLEKRECLCGEWNISGIPCIHASKAILYKRESLETYCHKSLHTKSFKAAYKNPIHAIPDPGFWPKMEEVTPHAVNPPKLKSLPGRPKKHRRMELGEGRRKHTRTTTNRCGNCNGLGHNSRSCPRDKKWKKHKPRGKKEWLRQAAAHMPDNVPLGKCNIKYGQRRAHDHEASTSGGNGSKKRKGAATPSSRNGNKKQKKT